MDKQKVNYNLKFEEIIQGLTKKPKLLLHVCCAPCSTACLERLENYFDITLYFYNPNIDKKSEYELRSKQFEKISFPCIIEKYDHREFLERIRGLENEKEGGARCPVCFRLRMEKAFRYAKDNGFDFVTTSLTISPHKDSQAINQIGEQLQKIYNFPYLFSDFKKKDGYLLSIKISSELGLYRQNYCGCEFSKSTEI